MDELSGWRKEYLTGTLDREDLNQDPFEQLKIWLQDAHKAGIIEANAVTLATSNRKGHPSARIVLIRGIGKRGLQFYTSYESRKGQELLANPYCALVFFWAEIERQVRIEGYVEKLAPEESDAYFASRPVENQLSAWASNQSQVVPSREYLEAQYQNFQSKLKEPIPRPPNWGGFIAIPHIFEFWQGRKGRLHDRFRYSKIGDQSWRIERLAP